MSHNLQVQYLSGKFMHLTDALSRDFLLCNPSDQVIMLQVHSVKCNSNLFKDQVFINQTENDVALQEVISYCH